MATCLPFSPAASNQFTGIVIAIRVCVVYADWELRKIMSSYLFRRCRKGSAAWHIKRQWVWAFVDEAMTLHDIQYLDYKDLTKQ